MSSIEWLTHEDFAGRIGDRFDLTTTGDPLPLELIEAKESAHPGGRGPEGQERLQFSLTFRGPAVPVAPQATYHLVHPDLELDLFLVPVGPDPDGMCYQAVFA